jgi:hypothetical protein
MGIFRKSAKTGAAGGDTPPEGEAPARAPLPPAPPVSAPAKVSCLTFVVLFLLTIFVVLWRWKDGTAPIDQLGWILGMAVLTLIIPIVFYRTVSLWMFDEIARYPDLAEAWRAGVSELARHGMTLSSAPLFLIIGTGNERLRRSFMAASGEDFFLDGVCDAPSPFYWYATRDAIYLYLNDVCWMNAAIALYEAHVESRRVGAPMPGDQQRGGSPRKMAPVLGTLAPDLGGQAATTRPAPEGDVPSDRKATIDLNQPIAAAQSDAAHAPPPPRPVRAGGSHYVGTITPDQLMAAPSGGKYVTAPATGSRPVSTQRATNRLTSQQAGLQLQRLEYVCGVLRRRRHPVCPINGLMALLPFEMLKAGDQDIAELERAIAADLNTIYGELQLRCPVMAVVVSMDQERGFRELIRRIPNSIFREDALKQRFGHKFDLRVPATTEELKKFTSHVCGTFENFVYTLFREEQALSHPGNTSLYALLCKVRRTLKQRLGDVLGKGFGYDRQSNRAPVLFSGCYFAATGPKADRQAFVTGLLSKLRDDQEDIEWTSDALREDRRRGWAIRIGWALTAAVLLFLAYSLATKYFFTSPHGRTAQYPAAQGVARFAEAHLAAPCS